jgi:hypothetical protein
MKVEVVLEDIGAKENGAKARVALKYPPSHLKTKLTSCCSVGQLKN